MTSPITKKVKDEDEDPFADIMKKLKSAQSPDMQDNFAFKSPNLMDEEPPESFNLSNEHDDERISLESNSNGSGNVNEIIINNNENINNELCDHDETEIKIISSPEMEVEKISSTTSNSSPTLSLQTVSFFDYLSVNSSETSIPHSTFEATVPDSSSLETNIPNSSASPRGFRASILKHGLSALEKIGKSTADVVVNTRNKLSESTTTNIMPVECSQLITPDFNDEKSSFYDILKLYGGYTKLQVKVNIFTLLLIFIPFRIYK